MSDEINVKKVGNRLVASWPDPHDESTGNYSQCPACTRLVPIIDGRVVAHEVEPDVECGGRGYAPMTDDEVRKRLGQ